MTNLALTLTEQEILEIAELVQFCGQGQFYRPVNNRIARLMILIAEKKADEKKAIEKLACEIWEQQSKGYSTYNTRASRMNKESRK